MVYGLVIFVPAARVSITCYESSALPFLQPFCRFPLNNHVNTDAFHKEFLMYCLFNPIQGLTLWCNRGLRHARARQVHVLPAKPWKQGLNNRTKRTIPQRTSKTTRRQPRRPRDREESNTRNQMGKQQIKKQRGTSLHIIPPNERENMGKTARALR